jgi:hypothetical protein
VYDEEAGTMVRSGNSTMVWMLKYLLMSSNAKVESAGRSEVGVVPPFARPLV